MSENSFKTIDEQLNILKERGLAVENEEIAKEFLYQHNYYRISGYSLTLRNHDIFNENASFQNIIDIYMFDYKLRHILLKYIEIIETKFNSVYAYHLTEKFGALGYENEKYFTRSKEYNDIINKTNVAMETRKAHEAYLKHFLDELGQDVPFWAYIDLITIGNISKLYACSDMEVREKVADAFNIRTTKKAEIMKNCMHCMTILRNLCAHGSRLYNRFFVTKPTLKPRDLKALNNINGEPDNQHLFSYILIMRQLLNKQTFAQAKKEIIDLCNEIPFVKMKYYGFPQDWQNIL